MTLAEIKTMLESIDGFAGKVAYDSFPLNEAPPLPFICFLEIQSDNFSADGIVYHAIKEVQIELYSRYKDLANETLVDNKLTQYGIFYQKETIYLDDEKCYETIYRMEI